jgi:hypothetical protein
MESCKKSQLGQFFTTNYNYILSNLYIPNGTTHIIEPFTGNGDLLNFIPRDEIHKYEIECYDIEPKHNFIVQRDTITEPPDYTNKFVLTNPPYLARNKCKNKEIFDKYRVNDMYKCFISNLINNKCEGGILIIPLNFWSSIRNMDINLRKAFLNIYKIMRVNVFEEQVFDDTSYTVCSFQFARNDLSTTDNILFDIYPEKKTLNILLCAGNNYTIGGEIYCLPKQSRYKITRLIKGDNKNTNILAKCIDDNITNKICLKIVGDEDIFYDETPNKSARTYATLVITPELSLHEQEVLVAKFNKYLNHMRNKYHSLFMTNYRESNTIARKRISFELIYNIVGYILTNYDIVFEETIL